MNALGLEEWLHSNGIDASRVPEGGFIKVIRDLRKIHCEVYLYVDKNSEEIVFDQSGIPRTTIEVFNLLVEPGPELELSFL